MKKQALKGLQFAGLTLSALTLGSLAQASQLTVEVGYGFGGTSSSGLYSGSPDTAFVTVKNTSSDVFTGTLSLNAPGLYGSFFDTSGAITMNPGDTWTLLPGPESSNYGGFYKNQPSTSPTGPADDGALLTIVGGFDDCQIDFAIHDKDIHSGVFATNPFGVTLDNYILQGGDPYGRDTFDTFEVAQAHATFTVGCGVPDVGSSLTLLGSGLGALGLLRRKLAA